MATHEVKKEIAVLKEAEGNGWSKELNLISWYEKDPTLDIRTWSPDHSRCGKGITITKEEARILAYALKEYLGE